MSATMKVVGSAELSKALKGMGKSVRAAAAQAVAETAIEGEGRIKRLIQQGAKTGRVYNRRGRTHQASAPGQAPASDTGALIASIYYAAESELTYTVGSRLAYAAYLEFGTARMRPRPYFSIASEELKISFVRRLEAAIKKEIA